MATTAGTTAGFTPYSAYGGKSAHSIISMNVADSQTIVTGDVLTFASGQVSVNNAAATGIVGVAMESITTTTSTDRSRIPVALALPNALFTGTLTNTTAAVDITDPAFADLTVGATGKDFAEHADGYPVIIDATANDTLYLLAFANEQFKGANFVSGAAGTVNPRVIFMFNPNLTVFIGTGS